MMSSPLSSRARPVRRLAGLAVALAALAASAAHALTIVPYSAQALAAARKDGKPLVLQFHADWCPTCRAQDKAFKGLASIPQLDVTLMQADYDTEKALEREMNVTTQSTLIVFKGGAEHGRVVGETDPARLKALLQSAL